MCNKNVEPYKYTKGGLGGEAIMMCGSYFDILISTFRCFGVQQFCVHVIQNEDRSENSPPEHEKR